MELPKELLNAITEEAASIPFDKLLNSAIKIRELYLSKTRTGESMVTGYAEALAYSAARMPACYAASRTAIEYAIEFMEDIPRTMLDIGSGTGAAIWAADGLIYLNRICCIEREAAMIELGKRLAEQGSEAVSEASWQKGDISSLGELPRAELVTASYVLNELGSEEKIKEAAKKLFNAAKKLLIIIEPGTPEGYREINMLREYFVSLGGYIAAPCPECINCPMEENDWCHFTARISRFALLKRIKEADVPYEDEKFSFIAVSKIKLPQAETRLLRHPQIRSGHIMAEICTAEGKKSITVTRNDKELYKFLRKAKPGDAVSLCQE